MYQFEIHTTPYGPAAISSTVEIKNGVLFLDGAAVDVAYVDFIKIVQDKEEIQ